MIKRGRECVLKFKYISKLKKLARRLRNNSTTAEVIFWDQVKNKQFHGLDFHRQKSIGNFIVDFYCHKLRLVIKIDEITHDIPEMQEKNRIKEEYLRLKGLKVLRFLESDVQDNLDGVMQKLEEFVSD